MSYDAVISPDENNQVNSENKLFYSNRAEFEGVTKKEKADVTIEAGGSGTVGVVTKYITIFKKDGKTNAALAGAEFVLQELSGGNWHNIARGTTDQSGRLTFTQEPLEGEKYGTIVRLDKEKSYKRELCIDSMKQKHQIIIK